MFSNSNYDKTTLYMSLVDASKFIKASIVLLVSLFSITTLCVSSGGESTTTNPSIETKTQNRVSRWKNFRDRSVIKQKYDYSCGASALATLITFYFGENITEREIIKLIFEGKSKVEAEKVTKEGFSLFDLKKVAEKLGYFGGIYRLKLNHLKKLQAPVIILIQSKEYGHFAVFKGIRGDRVYLADPLQGNIRISIYRFNKRWQGIILAIDKKGVSFSELLNLHFSVYTCPEIFTTK